MDEKDDVEKPLLPPSLPRWWRVLPSLTLIIIISNIDSLILNDFIEYRYTNYYYQSNSSSTENTRELCLNATRTLHNSTVLTSTTTSKSPVSTTMSPDEIIQSSTASLNVFISLSATLPSIITSILLGANCDRIGRKPLIALPYLGKTIRYIILTAVAYYNLSNLWIILSVMFDGLFGTAALTILSSFAYVTDCTDRKKRTAGIIITDVIIVSSRFIPLLTVGIYLQEPKFIQTMVFTLLLSLSGFVYCIVLQPESNLNVQHLNFLQQLKQVKFGSVAKVFQVFFVKRPEHRQRSLLMLVAIHLSLIVMLMGHTAIYYLYLYGTPFCFDSFGVSLNSLAQTVITILFTIPFTLTIAKRTDHLVIPMLGFLAFMTQLVLVGIARDVWMLYLAVCIGGIYSVLTPVIRSRITKLVEPNEYAVVFILASVFESGGYYAISAVANEIYRVSLTYYQGLVFFVFAIVGAVGILLMLYV
jgi:PCFT/HCP family folate transporter-like MFS transporter 1/3